MKGYVCLLWALSLAVLVESSWFGTRHSRHRSVCPKYGSKDPLLLPHKLCSRFYVCIEGKETVMSCRQGRHFNKRSGQCEPVLKARCGEETSHDDSMKWVIIGMRSQIKGAPFSLLALFPSSAIKKDHLSHGSALKRIRHTWLRKYLTKSSLSGSAEQQQHSFEERSRIKCPPYKYVRYEHFACIWGKKVSVGCPPGTYFSSATSHCKRRNDPSDQDRKLSPEQQHQGSINRLWDRIQATVDARHGCAPGMNYDGARCTEGHRVVHTDDRPMLRCPLYMEGKKLRNVYDCKTYYYCDGGIQKLFDCPPNLFFDPNTHRCNLNGKWFC